MSAKKSQKSQKSQKRVPLFAPYTEEEMKDFSNQEWITFNRALQTFKEHYKIEE